MKIEKITFMQTFPTGQFANQKLGVEIEVETPNPVTGESNWDAAMDAFKEAKELVNKAFMKMNPDAERYFQTTESQPIQDPKDQRIEAFIRDIEACTSVYEKNGMGVQVGLVAFEDAAKADPRIQTAYDFQMIKLNKQ